LEKDSKKISKYSQRIRELIQNYKDQALFSRELATIRKDTPIDFSLEDLAWRNFDRLGVEKIFNELGFRSLLSRLPQGTAASPPESYDKIEEFYKDGIFSKEIYELEKKLAPVIKCMEEAGIKIDKKHFAKLSTEITKELSEVQDSIYSISGRKFNINSPQQLSKTLFTDLQLPTKGLKKTHGGVVSTAAPELEKLENAHPVVKELLKYRELQKLYSTYIKPLPQVADQNDRIHTSFDSLGTSTGRISSKNPNLQNIPIKGEWGTNIRKGFIAEEGFNLVAFDYSQMELRIAAHVSGDTKMQEFFIEGKDIHTMTAAEVFGINENEVTSDMRNRAKALNFGVLYGMGASGFAKSAEIPRNDAQIFIDNYFGRFPEILEYLEKTKEFARENGYVSTIFGRKRYIPEINSSNPKLRSQAERMAINHPIQGTAADIVKMAMVKVSSQLSIVNCQLLLQIHDELLFEIRDDIIKNIVIPIKSIMENIYSLRAPLRVSVAQGSSWGELKK
jgi:DNA polymerase-1